MKSKRGLNRKKLFVKVWNRLIKGKWICRNKEIYIKTNINCINKANKAHCFLNYIQVL